MRNLFRSKSKKINKSNEFAWGFPVDKIGTDLYLVEYPKCGITWVSFILSNILCEVNKKDFDITYFNIHQLIPDMQMSKYAGTAVFNYPGYRIIKSHTKFHRNVQYCVYILRHPNDVMISYYSFLSDRELFQGTLEEFVKDVRFGVVAYKEHVESWLCGRKGGTHVHLITYESLKNDPVKAVGALIANLGWRKVDNQCIKRAVERSEMIKMKQAEKIYRDNDPSYNHHFVGRGQLTNNNKDQLTDGIKRYIYENAKVVIDQFYPK